jgi:hypothetical protein
LVQRVHHLIDLFIGGVDLGFDFLALPRLSNPDTIVVEGTF